MGSVRSTAVGLGILVLLSATAGVGFGQSADAGVEVEASPTDWDEAEATHTVVFAVGSDAESAGGPVENVVVDYEPGEQPADVSNVGPDAVERIGVDRDGDDVGTRVDEEATVTEVGARQDGQTLRIETAGELQVSAGDEVVVVYQGVQNPQDQGSTVQSAVNVTLNEDGAADGAADDVRYEFNDAAVTMSDQETAGGSVTVDSADLSEGGFVVVLNESGRNPGAVRGAAYLEPGSHEDVHVDVDPGVSDEEELFAQVHLDTNGDQRFDYDGGLVDRPFENRDGAVLATDSARVTYSEGAATPTEADGANATATPTGTATSTDTPGGPDETPDGGDGDTPGDGDASTGDETNGTADGETEDGSTAGDADGETENGTEGDAAGDEAGDAETADDETTAEDGAGFGLATALVALLGGSLLRYRRSSEADGRR
jgi:hypothetical protein